MLVPAEQELTPRYKSKKAEVALKVGGQTVMEAFKRKQDISPKVGNSDNESFMKKKEVSPEIIAAY